MIPGTRVRIIDRHSTRRGSVGTVIRHSPARLTGDGQDIKEFVYVKIDWMPYALPYFPADLEPLP